MEVKQDYKVYPLFSSPVYYSNVGQLDVVEVEQIRKVDDSSLYVDPKGFNYTNQYDIIDAFPSLKKSIEKHFFKYIYDALCLDRDVGWKFSDSWIVKFPPHTSTNGSFHSHSGSLFSGVLYIDSVDKGSITFSRPKQTGFLSMNFNTIVSKSYNIYNSPTWEFNPIDGDIIIFPSGLEHMVSTNNSSSDRLSFAFNIVPTGIISTTLTGRLAYDV
jgi:uncharacterized protein (TIGR02466 family)